MVGCIAFSNLSTLHIDLNNTKATDQIGIDAINTNTAYRLVASHYFRIEVADIDDVSVGLNQIDV